jgi:hypothetical protein
LRGLKHPKVAQVPWRRLAKWSAWTLLAAIVIFVNRAPQLLASYATTMPLKAYYAILFISLLFITAIYMAAAFLLLGLSWFLIERTFGRGRIPLWSGMRPEYYRDAFCVGLFGTVAVMGLNRLPGLFERGRSFGIRWVRPCQAVWMLSTHPRRRSPRGFRLLFLR